MGILSVGLTFVGYLLVYASVANHGQFVKEPWLGVFSDAYDAGSSSSGDSSSGAALPLAPTTSTAPSARGSRPRTPRVHDTAGQGPTAA